MQVSSYVLDVQLVHNRVLVTLISANNQRFSIDEPVYYPLLLYNPTSQLVLPEPIPHDRYTYSKESVVILRCSTPLERRVWATHFRQLGSTVSEKIDPVLWWRMTRLTSSFVSHLQLDGRGLQSSSERFLVPWRVMSLDVEASGSAEFLYSVAIHGYDSFGEYRHILMMGEGINTDTLFFFDTESELLTQLIQLINARDPDLLIGWHIREFDIRYLVKKCREHGFEFEIGRFGFSDVLMPDKKALPIIPGRLILDGAVCLNRLGVALDGQSLEAVSKQLLGEGKSISGGIDKIREIERLFREDKVSLGNYNLRDAELVTRIFQNQSILNRLETVSTPFSGTLMDALIPGQLLGHYLSSELLATGECPSMGIKPIKSTSFSGFARFGVARQMVIIHLPFWVTQMCLLFDIDPIEQSHAQLSWLSDPRDWWNRLYHSQSEAYLLESELRYLSSHPHSPIRHHPFSSQLQDALSKTHRVIVEQARGMGGHCIYDSTDWMVFEVEATGVWDDQQLTDALQEWSYLLHGKHRLQLDIRPMVEFGHLFHDPIRGDWVGFLDGETVSHLSFADGVQFSLPILHRLLSHLLVAESKGDPLNESFSVFCKELQTGKWDSELVYRHRVRGLAGKRGKTPPHVLAARKNRQQSGVIEYVHAQSGPLPIALKTPNEPLDYTHYIHSELLPFLGLFT